MLHVGEPDGVPGRKYVAGQGVRGQRRERQVLGAERPTCQWQLPDKRDKAAILVLRTEAVRFGEENGATEGQLAAIKKALTSNDYYISGPRPRGRRAS